MIFDHPGLFLDRFQSTADGPSIPFIKVMPCPSRIAMIPEATEACLDGPDSGHLQVGLFEFIKLLGEGFIEILFNVLGAQNNANRWQTASCPNAASFVAFYRHAWDSSLDTSGRHQCHPYTQFECLLDTLTCPDQPC